LPRATPVATNLSTTKRIAILIFLTVACVGCPQRIARRHLVLTGVVGAADTSVDEPTNAPEVQTAITIITAALAAHGLAPTTNTNLTIADSLVTYAEFTPEGRPMIGRDAWVSVTNRALIFTVAEESHLSADSKSIIQAVKKELKKRYGTSRLKTKV
jgi:hypothetical protein